MLKKIVTAKTSLLALLCCLLGLSAGADLAGAEGNGASYNYSYWGTAVNAPPAYMPTDLYRGEDMGSGALKDPSDLHVTADGQIYVLDSGNNRILKLNEEFKVQQIIDSFLLDGKQETFLNPQGLFVSGDKQLIVADTGHKRVVILDEKNELISVLEAPESELLSATFQFQPIRVVMDHAQRVYVMATGVFDGFMEFNAEGEFSSFIGANRVNVDPVDYFWKQISTKAQRSQMIMFTPTEFTNLDIDEEGFIYATNGDEWGQNIKKLNAQGSDILRRTGYYDPQGDLVYTSDIGPSRLIDIDVTDSEIYSVLDSKRGRVFTYSGDGHFMYVFGGIGNQLGEFNTPTAIDRLGDDFIVLDKALGEITRFRATEYGRTLNEAIRSYYRGDDEAAYEWFNKTIGLNANLEFAYAGIGKALVRQGDYNDAMKQFKRSMDQRNYSKAFLLYRKQVMREHFTLIMTTLAVLVIGWIVFRRYRKAVKRRGLTV